MKAKYKNEIAREYNISYTTFLRWLKDVPDLVLKPKQRLLSPKQIRAIYFFYGNPTGE